MSPAPRTEFELPQVARPARRVTEREALHRDPFTSVERCHTEVTGFAKDYYVVDFGPRSGVLLLRDAQVLLTAQYRFLLDAVSWEIPGGALEPGESHIETARRECLEETGYDCGEPQLLLAYRPGLDNVENPTEIFYSETARQVRAFTPDPAEVLDLAWVDIEDCVSLALRRKLFDCVTVSAVLAYRCLMARGVV